MKVYKILIAAFILIGTFTSISLSAQDDREDVVYLKNGNIYRGVIVEQVPGKTLKVETLGGNVFTVDINDITKITKEKKIMADDNGGPGGRGDMHHPYDGPRDFHHDMYHRYSRLDSAHGGNYFHYHKRGYFFKAQLLAEMGQGGIRIINGYKFGQFGYLGLGIGADLIGFAPMGHYDFGGRGAPYAGTYLPLFLHYSGDILKKRITPYYTVEAGYAMKYGGRGIGMFGNSVFNGTNRGGMMGGVGFGVKINTRHRVNFNISVNADFQNTQYNSNYNIDNSNGMTFRRGGTLTLLTPGLKFGIGF